VRVHNHLVLPGPSLCLVLEFSDVDRKHDWIHCELNHKHGQSQEIETPYQLLLPLRLIELDALPCCTSADLALDPVK